MELTDIEKYSQIMKEIKLRVALINVALATPPEPDRIPMTIEAVGLQFRKVFELIAFATLVANRVQYSLVYRKFAEDWEAGKLLRQLKKINPNFYPQPAIETVSAFRRILRSFTDRDEGYLTDVELIEAHGRCGGLMHAANPFAAPIDYDFFQRSFPVWATKIMTLLNVHKVQLVGDTGFYLVHMKELGDDEVRWYRLDPQEHQTE